MSKKYDLTGQKFGKLTVLNKTDPPKETKKKRTFWLCQCECGNYYVTHTTSLLSGKTTQCLDCAHKATGLKKRADYTGQKFGKLTITKMLYDYKGSQRTYCECKCDCGNTTIATIDSLKKKGLHSCGCEKRNIIIKNCGRDIDGQKFGRLTILETLWDKSPVKVRCLCDCGNKVILNKNDVQSGHTQSCGCLHREKTIEANTKDWSGYVSPYGVKLIKQEEYKNNKWYWLCQCGLCGKEFISIPAVIASGATSSCGCRTTSKGEQLIEEILINNHVDYKKQYSFNDCRYINVLRFDFAIMRNNEPIYLIEYNGRQHYESVEYFGGEEQFELNKLRDQIKDDYCKKNNIPLLKLPYTLTVEEIKEKIIDIINP